MNRLSKGIRLFALFVILNVGLASIVLAQASVGNATVSGFIYGQDGPIDGATVRIQATANEARTDADGAFTLSGLTTGEAVTVTASAPGHYINWMMAQPNGESITITLDEYYLTDNHEYEWFEEDGLEGSAACGSCHTSHGEWLSDGHSQAATNYRFLTMYAGTDVHGNKSPPPKKNNIGIPLPPDLDDPYHGPGFKLDFPNNAGKCATCHTPMAAKIPNQQNCGWAGCHQDGTASFAGDILDPGVSPLGLHGDAAEGISCEFCHKIGDVYLNSETGLPYPDLPGILSYKLHRPAEGHDLIFGSVDDIARTDVPEPRDAYLPLQEESAFCAGCHYGILGDVVIGNQQTKGGVLIYSSFAEWLESAYADEEDGQTCQDCHMRAGDYEYFAWPEKGGVARDPAQVHNHQMLSEDLLQAAVTLTATAVITHGQLLVDVEIFNDGTGHHMPTDSPLRHALLVIEAKNGNGRPLRLLSGPQLPEWAGDYAGDPGRVYAKILRDKWTNETPTGAIWRPVEIEMDTRIPALESDASSYVFRSPAGGVAEVNVQLIYRKAFQQLMAQKGWDDPDIVMEETTLQVEER